MNQSKAINLLGLFAKVNEQAHVKAFDLYWILPVLILGVLGAVFNGFTCSAILYARYKRRHGFHKDWYKSSIFVFNLTFLDFCCSFLMMTVYIVFTIAAIRDEKHLSMGRHSCAFFSVFPEILILIEAYSIALIAVTRMLFLMKPLFWHKFCSTRWKVYCLIAYVWLLGVLWNIPRIKQAITEASSKDYKYCMQVNSNLNRGSNHRSIIIDFLAHIITFAIVIGSYSLIRYQYIQTQKSLKDTVVPLKEFKSKKKEKQITKTMLIICSTFILQCLLRLSARLLCFVHDTDENTNQNWCGNTWFIQFQSTCIKLCYIVYYSQFVTNIFIYVFQKDQYWKACKDLMLRFTVSRSKFEIEREQETTGSSAQEKKNRLTTQKSTQDLTYLKK